MRRIALLLIVLVLMTALGMFAMDNPHQGDTFIEGVSSVMSQMPQHTFMSPAGMPEPNLDGRAHLLDALLELVILWVFSATCLIPIFLAKYSSILRQKPLVTIRD